jgi:hypothetical protein
VECVITLIVFVVLDKNLSLLEMPLCYQLQSHLFLISILYLCKCEIIIGVDEKPLHSLATCVNRIVTKYYDPGIMIILIDTDFQISHPCVYQNSPKKNYTTFIRRMPEMYVITLRSANLEELVHYLEKFDIFNSRAKFIIVLVVEVEYDMLFQKLAEYFIYNVVVLDVEENLVTYDPFVYEDASASGVEPTVLGKCSEFRFSQTDHLFNKTMPSLWRNTTVLAVYSEFYPYLYVENGDVVGEYYQIPKMLAERLGFKVKSEDIKSVVKNGTSVDMLGTDLHTVYFINYVRYVAAKGETHDAQPWRYQSVQIFQI